MSRTLKNKISSQRSTAQFLPSAADNNMMEMTSAEGRSAAAASPNNSLIPGEKMMFCGLIRETTWDRIMKCVAVAMVGAHLSSMISSISLFSNLPKCCGYKEQGYDPNSAIAGLVFAIIHGLIVLGSLPADKETYKLRWYPSVVLFAAVYNICAAICFINELQLGQNKTMVPLLFVTVGMGVCASIFQALTAMWELCCGQERSRLCWTNLFVFCMVFVSLFLCLVQFAFVVLAAHLGYDKGYFHYQSFIPGFSWDGKYMDCEAYSGTADYYTTSSEKGDVDNYCPDFYAGDGSTPRPCCVWYPVD